MSALEELQQHYRHRDQAARAWKSGGGRVVGYLCDNVPEELILAAGFLPYRLSGAPAFATEPLERYVQPFAAPFSARNRGVGFVDAILAMLLSGQFDFLDYLIVPHTRKAIQAFYRELTLAKQSDASLRLPELFYLDRAYTPFYAAEVFNRQSLVELRAQLESWSGHELGATALADAIETTNISRSLLRRIAELRSADPPRISGVNALQMIGASFFMDKREHNQLLQAFIDEAPADGLSGRPRLFVGGSPLDNLSFYELVESCGAVIVAEDHCWGNRCGEFQADTSLPAFEALADRYHRKPACSIEFPMARVLERCAGRASAARVNGAIFFVMEGDGVHIWDTPQEVAALEHDGVPCLVLNRQPYRLDDAEALRARLTEFTGTLYE
ncbi:MAG TPA: 2-hydroxyacyl-CoA dehydratase family protein [Ktedonobacterales bacterium]|nr:2-hydroxyacyl-CoA dehydratase family protein [Ktedonobacterales bacterium]